MPPKPRPLKRKDSSASKNPPNASTNASATSSTASKPTSAPGAMLPPPDPLPPQAILEPELNAMTACLKNAAARTGQIQAFYADAKRLNIDRYAPQPHQGLTAALGREFEKYDQLCDAMESHLLHAIAVLQRDMERERARLRAEAEAEALKPPPEKIKPPPSETNVDTSQTGEPASTGTRPSSPTAPSLTIPPDPSLSPSTSKQSSPPIPGGTTPAARRQSTISLSSLNRPQFPHKLDLSAAALRINPEEIQSGLASPVTLAPKSGRITATNEYPPDLFAAMHSSMTNGPVPDPSNRPVDIDLTLDSDPPQTQVGLGNSADKPIELDLDIDMADLFSDHVEGVDGDNQELFGVPPPPTTGGAEPVPKKEGDDQNMSMDMIDFSGVRDAGPVPEDLFQSLANQSNDAEESGFSPSDSLVPPAESNEPGSSTQGAVSPGTLLANIGGSSSGQDGASRDLMPMDGGAGADTTFDLANMDFAAFTSTFDFNGAEDGELDMDALLNLGHVNGEGDAAGGAS